MLENLGWLEESKIETYQQGVGRSPRWLRRSSFTVGVLLQLTYTRKRRFSAHSSFLLLRYGHGDNWNWILNIKEKILHFSTVGDGSSAVAAGGRPPSPMYGFSSPTKAVRLGLWFPRMRWIKYPPHVDLDRLFMNTWPFLICWIYLIRRMNPARTIELNLTVRSCLKMECI